MKKGVFFILFVVLSVFFTQGVSLSQEKEELDFSVPEVFEYPAVKGRDPFSPLVKKPEEKQEKKVVEEKKEEKKPLPVIINSEFKLMGIVWHKTGAVAFIAGRGKTWVVEEGASVNGFKVARIEGEKGEVTLLGKDKIIKLKMLKL